MARGLKAFFLAALSVALAAMGAAALSKSAPLAQVAVGAGLAMALVVFAAARAGSPRWFGARHLFGLGFAALAIALHWIAWSGFAEAESLSAFDLDAALAAALNPPEEWLNELSRIAQKVSFTAGGKIIAGETLYAAWLAQSALIAIAGLMGGHSAYWRPRSRL